MLMGANPYSEESPGSAGAVALEEVLLGVSGLGNRSYSGQDSSAAEHTDGMALCSRTMMVVGTGRFLAVQVLAVAALDQP